MTAFSKLINHPTQSGHRGYLYNPSLEGATIKVHQKIGKNPAQCPKGFKALLPGDFIALHQRGTYQSYVVTHLVQVQDNGLQYDAAHAPYSWFRDCKVLSYLDPTKAPVSNFNATDNSYELGKGFNGITMQDVYAPQGFYVGNGHVRELLKVDLRTLVRYLQNHPHYSHIAIPVL